MTKFTGASGHDMDFSIHEPSIRPGESVSGLDKWIDGHKKNLYIGALSRHSLHGRDVVPVEELRDFMKGRVLVDAKKLKIAMEIGQNNSMSCDEVEACEHVMEALHPNA